MRGRHIGRVRLIGICLASLLILLALVLAACGAGAATASYLRQAYVPVFTFAGASPVITSGLNQSIQDDLEFALQAEGRPILVMSPKDKRGTGEHEPMLMAIQFGQGRVFHTALGHGGKQLKSVAFIVTYQRGAEWAATGKVTQKVPADFPGPDAPSLRP